MGTIKLFRAVLIWAIFFPLQMLGWGTEVNGIYYSFDTKNKTACVESGHGYFEDGPVFNYYSGDLVIPETVVYEGIVYTVSSIRGGHEDGGYMPYNAGPFENSNISSIKIPKTIKKIETYAFRCSKSLKSVIFEGNIESIGEGAFLDCSGIESFEIPEGVETLNYRTFEGCSSLESLTIPTTLKVIGGYMFGGFENLRSIHIKDIAAWCNISVSYAEENPLYYAHHLYLNGEEVTELEIPQETTVVGGNVFSGCEGITSVVFHKDVESIGWLCFSDCKNLETITISGSGTVINQQAFHNCSKLKDIYCDTEKCPAVSDFDESTYENATLHVKDYAVVSFKADEVWSKFKKIDVEKVTEFKLTYYVDGEIYKTEQLKYEDEITPEPNPIKKGMTFSGWSDIPATMPGKDVKVTGTLSWSKIAKDGVMYQVYDAENELAGVIGSDNASGEVKIVSPVEIDGYKYSVTDIVDFVFKNNTDITSVVIPESVRKIGDEAFYGCKNLAKIELGKSVNQIEPRAFAGIDKLTDITIYAEDVPSTDRTAFENSYTEDYVTLHVPAGSVEKYKAAAPWKNFKEIVAIPDADTDDTDVDVVTIKSYGKGTYCSDYDLDFSYTENLKAFIVTGYDHKTNTIWLTRVKSVPAGTGIIVKGTPGDYKVKHVESLSVYANFLVGTTEDKKIKDVEGEMTNFVLSKGEWYRFDGEITLPKGMAYLPLPLSKFAGTRSLTEVYEDNDEGTTEIRTIEQGTVSSEHDVWFNLQGQRVDKPRKGLYIRNGKKVVIK